MHVHCEDLPDVARYIEQHADIAFEDQKPTIEGIIDTVRKYKSLDSKTRILEIGVGSGWLQVYCKKQGLQIHGLEISAQLAAFAKEVGQKYGTELDIEVGNIEMTDIGVAEHDVIIASSVFEHVEDWQRGVKKIYKHLRPGGAFFFSATNKFSFTSGEYSFPLYGWMPNSWRYRLRRARQGEDIMKLGIDFHQFTYPQLRRAFKRTGFSTVLDLVDYKDVSQMRSRQLWKKKVFGLMKTHKPLKHLYLTFATSTYFICVKGV